MSDADVARRLVSERDTVGHDGANKYRVSHDTLVADDDEFWRFVEDHPSGADFEEIGQAFDPPLTRQRVEQLEKIALRKLGLRQRLHPGVRELYELKSELDGALHPLAKAQGK